MPPPKIYTDEELIEHRRESSREWARNNKEHQKARYHKNKEEILKRQKQRLESESAEQKELRKKYNREYKSEYVKNNPEVLEAAKERQKKRRESLIVMLGNKCEMCGFDDYRALQIDHINHDGAEERKKNRSFSALEKDVLKYGKDKYQVLCANCNTIKEYDRRKGKT